MVLLQKFGLALGLFIVGIALDSAGFIEAVAGEPLPVQPPSALGAIRWAVGPIPMLCLILGIGLTLFYPINRDRHAEIMLRLHEKKSQANR